MKIRSTITAVGAVAALGAAGVAFAPGAFADTSGTERFQITTANDTTSVIATGLFTDGGLDQEGNTNYDVLHLSNGDIRLTHPERLTTIDEFHINGTTCYASGTQKGTYLVSHGTGAYAGIHGHGTYNAKFHDVFSTTGGSCNFDAPPLATNAVITAHGPVVMP